MSLDRRSVLRVGASAVVAAVARKLLPGRREAGPALASATVLWAGDALQTTVELTCLTVGAASLAPTISLNRDMSGAVVLPAAARGSFGWNRWHADGLEAGRPYFWQLTDSSGGGDPQPFGPIATFTTLREAGQPCTIRRVAGSCSKSAGGPAAANPAAYDDIIAWSPDRMTHLGDLGYQTGLTSQVGTHVQALNRNLQMPGISEALPLFCVDYIHSDHDTNGGNNLPNYHDPVTKASLRAWRLMVPSRLADVREPIHGVWRSEVEGRVRFLKLDYRSVDRTDSIGRSPTDPTSSMLGATQLRWVRAELAAAAAARQLVVLLTDSAWNGVAPDPVDVYSSDKMPAYQHQRDLVSDWAAQLGLSMVIIHGDTHLLLHDETHERNGFVVVGCAPLDQLAQGLFQDSADWVYPPGQPPVGGTMEVQQYQRLTWADDGTTITFTAEARSCSDAGGDTVHVLTRTYVP